MDAATRKRLYNIWWGMNYRCSNPSATNYKWYGGRGVRVCSRWASSFDNFLMDMYPSYFKGAQIDRADNDQGYNPDNCQWVTYHENARNKSSNRIVTVEGRDMIVADAARMHGLEPDVVLDRVNRYGWDMETALNTPVKRPKTYRFNDADMTVGQISKITGINRETLRLRLKRGMSVAEATSNMVQ